MRDTRTALQMGPPKAKMPPKIPAKAEPGVPPAVQAEGYVDACQPGGEEEEGIVQGIDRYHPAEQGGANHSRGDPHQQGKGQSR